MFKIENYIAPLILSKVEKFVKNINPADFNVSATFFVQKFESNDTSLAGFAVARRCCVPEP